MKQVPKIKKSERTKMMKAKRMMSLAVLVLIVGFVISATPIVQAGDGPIFMEEMVEMRDGVKLYTRIYLPDPSVFPPPYPAILTRTPYGIGKPTWYGGVPPDPAKPAQWPGDIFHGYARVFQDTRGRYFSEGVDRIFYDEGPDGYDTIEWIAKQTWCNGKVGMTGSSAVGITQFLAASENPPSLKAIFPASSSGNLLNDLVFLGGTFRFADSRAWTLGQTLSKLSTSHLQTVVPPPQWPYISSYLMDCYKIRVDLLSHMSLTYPNRPVDSKWSMHLPLKGFNSSFSILQPFVDEILSHPSEDEFRDHYKAYDKVNVPTLLATAWYDFFTIGQIDAFVDLQSRGISVKLLVGNGTHARAGLHFPVSHGIPYVPYYEWFDYWLKGIDTGIMDEPSISYNTMGVDEWHWADQWPPGGIRYTNYYLQEGGVLSTDPPTVGEEPESYIYDPMNPVLTWGGGNLALPKWSFDQRPVEEGRDDILIYTSNVLTEDVEITGPIKVVLSASSNATDTDFTAKLIDVHPDGSAMLIIDNIIRARYRESMSEPVLMEPSEIYKFTIDLGDTSQVFKAGHRIQVDISSSNFPKHDRNLNSGGELYTETEVDIKIANNTIYHDADNPSYIVLPVMSPKPKVFEGYAKIDTKEATYEGPAELHTYKHAVYIHFDDQWIKWEIINHVQTEDREIYTCEKGLKVTVWTKRKTGETFALAKAPKVRFFGKAV